MEHPPIRSDYKFKVGILYIQLFYLSKTFQAIFWTIYISGDINLLKSILQIPKEIHHCTRKFRNSTTITKPILKLVNAITVPAHADTHPFL